MVRALVTLSERTNRVLNIVKAAHSLRTKSEAIEKMVEEYERELLEPSLRPEYVRRLKRIEREKSVSVKNFGKGRFSR